MRSPEVWLLALCLCAGIARAEVPPPAMTASAVQAAASAVMADPLLPGKEKSRTLRFKEDKDQNKRDAGKDMDWWMQALANLSAGMRVAMWLGGAGLLIWVLLRLRDWLRARGGRGEAAALPPTHVGSLDIRPESLPADIGAAARALLDRGEQRAALSLLYRGALSRLVHGHGVPIRAASTERECLALSAPRLSAEALAFLRSLVSAWQAVAYAQRHLPADAVVQLCQGFDPALRPAMPGAGA